eukprot:450075-Pleurochrysis_carterae.AAC.10
MPSLGKVFASIKNKHRCWGPHCSRAQYWLFRMEQYCLFHEITLLLAGHCLPQQIHNFFRCCLEMRGSSIQVSSTHGNCKCLRAAGYLGECLTPFLTSGRKLTPAEVLERIYGAVDELALCEKRTAPRFFMSCMSPLCTRWFGLTPDRIAMSMR